MAADRGGAARTDQREHSGLKAAMRKTLKAEWQRCQVHSYRNVLCQISKRSQAEVSEAMKAVFVQRDEKSAKAKAAYRLGPRVLLLAPLNRRDALNPVPECPVAL